METTLWQDRDMKTELAQYLNDETTKLKAQQRAERLLVEVQKHQNENIYPCTLRCKMDHLLIVHFEAAGVGTIVTGEHVLEVEGEKVVEGKGCKDWHWIMDCFETIA